MNIEERLESIDTSLKTLVTILQSAGAISAVAGAPETAATAPAADTKKPRGKAKEESAAKQDLVAGDPEGTRYWVSEEAKTAYAQKPGDPDPKDQSFKIESSAHYLAKKAEFAKNAQDAAAASQQPATTEPSATAPADGASVDWDTTFRAIKDLSTAPAPNGGREAVLRVLKHFGCEGKLVPALKDLNKNAEILAHVTALMTPAQDSDLGL